MHMNENELDAIVEARLEAELAARHEADRQRVKMEVVDQIRREASRAHYDKINARHPVEDKWGGLGRAGHEARLRDMDARAKAANAHMDEVNSRPVPGGLLDQRNRADSAGGSAGFEIRPGRRS
jgi:hypothetical protein